MLVADSGAVSYVLRTHNRFVRCNSLAPKENDSTPANEHFLNKLEQLERLRSEIPSAAPWLPMPVIHNRSQVKTRQSQSDKVAKIPNW